MHNWLDKVIVGVLILWAVGYIIRSLIKKIKAPGCSDSCSCEARKLVKPQRKHWFHR